MRIEIGLPFFRISASLLEFKQDWHDLLYPCTIFSFDVEVGGDPPRYYRIGIGLDIGWDEGLVVEFDFGAHPWFWLHRDNLL